MARRRELFHRILVAMNDEEPRRAGTAVSPAAAAGVVTNAGTALVTLAMLPAVATVAVAITTGQDLAAVARLLITAVVYGPVAAIALAYRRTDVATLTGALAVSSGWLAFLVLLQQVLPDVPAVVAATGGVGRVAGVAELAALGLLGWLVVRTRDHPCRAGVVLGLLGPALGAAYAILTPTASKAGALIAVPLILSMVSFVVAVLAAALRWRGGDGRERAARGWFLVGAILTSVSYVRVVVPLPLPSSLLVDAAFVCAQGCLPVAILMIVIRTPPRTLTVAAIATAQSLAFGAAAYMAVTGLGGLLGMDALVAGAVAAAAMALVYGATAASSRTRLSTLLTGRIPGAREVLGHLGERLNDPAGEGVAELAAALRDTWGVASVEITLSAGEVVRVGSSAPESIFTSLRSASQTIGRLTLTSDDRRALERIAPVLSQTAGLIAAVVHLAAVNEEATATRQRTLDVRREERRVLHGELHDSLAPALAGIGFGLAAADTLLIRDDHRWLAALRELREDTSASMETVRRLARALLPTALDQGDLEGALTELGNAVSAEGLHVELDAHGTDVLDVHVQLSLYLLLADVISHARRTPGLLAVVGAISLLDDTVRVTLHVDGLSDDVVNQMATLVRQRADQLGAIAVDVEEDVIRTEFRR